MTADKRRKRRVAADEAHAWARDLRLGNHHGKSVLKSLTLYVDGDGYCFVGIEALAYDCELSGDTVRRRLVWLEEIGAISRAKQWIDGHGVRNSEGRGKQTSDLIRLLVDADQDAIEARAAGQTVEPETSDNSTSISPSSQQGLNQPAETVSPAPALRQPSHCGDGLISEPEPESPPKPPSGGSVADDGWKEFQADWSEPILRQSIAQDEWATLTPEQRILARRAARGYFIWRRQQRKPPNVLSAHLFLRERDAWAGFAALAPDLGSVPETRWICGDELAGFLVACRLADRPPPRLVEDGDRRLGFPSIMRLQADLVAMAKFRNDDPHVWPVGDRGSPQCAAWRDRLRLWLGGEIEPRKVFLEEYNAAVHGLPHTHPDFKFRKSQTGLPMPAPWPPHRDGTWPEENANEGDAA